MKQYTESEKTIIKEEMQKVFDDSVVSFEGTLINVEYSTSIREEMKEELVEGALESINDESYDCVYFYVETKIRMSLVKI